MKKLPSKCVVDTNVPMTANLSLAPDMIPQGLVEDEYRQNLSMKGQPGVGDRFMKWVHDHRWSFPDGDRVSITKDGASYSQFPSDARLTGFDPSDRKFVAVANAHPQKPVILEGTDSKWWGWKDILADNGINVHFLAPDYVRAKYAEKLGT